MAGPRPEIEPDPALFVYLASHDAPCDWCGYNLRGVTTPRCPECGGPLDLDFVMNPPSQRRDPADPLRRMTRQEWLASASAVVVIIALFLLAVWLN